MKKKEVHSVELDPFNEVTLGGKIIGPNQISLIKDVAVAVEAFIGSANMTVGELFDLKENSIVKLDGSTESPIDLVLNGKVVARGNLVVVDENFGLQITQILG